MRRAAVLVAGSVALALASCTSAADGDRPGPDAGPDAALVEAAGTLSVSVSQNGRDVFARRIQVKVTQGSGVPLALRGVDVVVPGFTGTSHRDLETSTRPGGGLDLPVPVGETDCTTADSQGPVGVRLTVAGLERPIELEAPDANGALARWHRTQCDAIAVTELVPLAWSQEWTPQATGTGLVSTGSLRIGPVPAGHAVTLTGLDSTVLFTPTPGQGAEVVRLPVDVAAGEAIDLPVSLAPTRCDAHAVSEGLPQRGFSFRLRIGLDGGEAAAVTLLPPEAARDVMLAALLEECGLG